MQSFEQVYKNVLKEDLENLLQRKVFITNDISYRPLEQDKSSVVAVIKSAQGTKSSVPSYDLNTLPLNTYFIVEANYLQEFIGALNGYIKVHNGRAKTIELNEQLSYYRAIYNNPTPVGSTFDLQAPNKTFKAVMVLLTGSIVHSSNVLLDQFIPVLKIGTVEYPMNYLLRCEFTMQPVVDPVAIVGDRFSKKTIINLETTYLFTLLSVNDDDLSELLYSLYLDEVIDFSEIYLKIEEGPFVKIQSLQVYYVWESGVASYNLTLVR